MAERPLYIPLNDGDLLVKTVLVEFHWHPGMAISQKQRSVSSLHHAAIEEKLCESPLEVSTKSQTELGMSLSAFNLQAMTKKHNVKFTVETAYQSSKVFECGGPYTDLLHTTSMKAKQDPRIQESGVLRKFSFFGEDWPLEPKTAFYDWLYLNALHKNEKAVAALSAYDAFTDIEFNPKKSINCQAYSVALYRSLQYRGLLQDVIGDRSAYFDVIASLPVCNTRENTQLQPRLI